MITPGEVVYAINGISRLVRFDRGGLAYFDRSIQGFWRSFSVALLVAPGYALLILMDLEEIKPTVGWLQVIAILILFYIATWVIYPVIAYELCRWLKRADEFPAYMTVYNWSRMLLVGAHVFAWLPTFAGVTDRSFSQGLELVIYLLFHIYLWFIARESLRIDSVTAIGLVAVNFMMSRILTAALVVSLRA